MEYFYNLAGFANIAAGILLLLFWYLFALLLPYRDLRETLSILVVNRNWVFINTLGVCGSLLGLFGLSGIYLKAADQIGLAGLLGYSLAFLGTALFSATLLWDTLIWPILAGHDPTLLDFKGPIYSSKTFVPFFILSGIIYSLGYVIFALSLTQTGSYPIWACIALMIGAPLFGLGAALGKLQVYTRSIGITLLSAALIWLGIFIIIKII